MNIAVEWCLHITPITAHPDFSPVPRHLGQHIARLLQLGIVHFLAAVGEGLRGMDGWMLDGMRDTSSTYYTVLVYYLYIIVTGTMYCSNYQYILPSSPLPPLELWAASNVERWTDSVGSSHQTESRSTSEMICYVCIQINDKQTVIFKSSFLPPLSHL